LKAARERDATSSPIHDLSEKRKGLGVNDVTEFFCIACSKGGLCMACGEIAVAADTFHTHSAGNVLEGSSNIVPPASNEQEVKTAEPSGEKPDDEMIETTNDSANNSLRSLELLFRCYTCKRLAHYGCLRVDDEDLSRVDVAAFYQKETNWQCGDCSSYVFPLDKILAWRESKTPESESSYSSSQKYSMNYRDHLPYEYLVKWTGRSYKRVEWVPHMWLLSTNASKLRQFAQAGTKVQLLEKSTLDSSDNAESIENAQSAADLVLLANNEDEQKAHRAKHESGGPPSSIPDAEERIPRQWKVVDRVLDVLLVRKSGKGKNRQKSRKEDNADEIEESSEDELESDIQAEVDAVYDRGEQPSDDLVQSIDEWERSARRKVGYRDIRKAIWVFIKWYDLPYEEGMLHLNPGEVLLLMQYDLFSYVGFATTSRFTRLCCF
jgi:hypothetical protein